MSTTFYFINIQRSKKKDFKNMVENTCKACLNMFEYIQQHIRVLLQRKVKNTKT